MSELKLTYVPRYVTLNKSEVVAVRYHVTSVDEMFAYCMCGVEQNTITNS